MTGPRLKVVEADTRARLKADSRFFPKDVPKDVQQNYILGAMAILDELRELYRSERDPKRDAMFSEKSYDSPNLEALDHFRIGFVAGLNHAIELIPSVKDK